MTDVPQPHSRTPQPEPKRVPPPVDLVGRSSPNPSDPDPVPGSDSTPARASGRSRPSGWALAMAGAAVALMLEAIFIGSYVGALHDPQPREALPFGVVAPPQVFGPLIQQMQDQASEIVDPRPIADEATLRSEIDHRKVYGGLIVGPQGLTLLVADAAGPAAASALTTFATGMATAQNTPLTVEHVHLLDTGDPRGLTITYLVFGWVFGGYFCATVLTTLLGSGYRNRSHALLRLALLAGYALLSGIAGAWLVGPLTNALSGHAIALVLAGTLTVFAVAASTMALQLVLGLPGTGLVLILFVLLGNPSSGGVVPAEFLPGFWRTIGDWLPNAAGYTLTRNLVYFDGNAISRSILLLVAYAVVGAIVLIALANHRRPSVLALDPEAELATGAAAL